MFSWISLHWKELLNTFILVIFLVTFFFNFLIKERYPAKLYLILYFFQCILIYFIIQLLYVHQAIGFDLTNTHLVLLTKILEQFSIFKYMTTKTGLIIYFYQFLIYIFKFFSYYNFYFIVFFCFYLSKFIYFILYISGVLDKGYFYFIFNTQFFYTRYLNILLFVIFIVFCILLYDYLTGLI